jgi:hypothetical protein
MPVSLDTADRKLVIAAIVLLVVMVGVAAVLAPQEQPEGPTGSSYFAAPNGSKAAFLLLQQLGYRVDISTVALADLPDPESGDVLVLAEPAEGDIGKADREHLAQYMEGGGRVLVTGRIGTLALMEKMPEAINPLAASELEYPAIVPGRLTDGAPTIWMAAETRWRSEHAAVPLYAAGGNIVAVTYRVGRGEVIWLAGATPLTNSGISQKNNLELLLNCLGPAATTHVMWDEYYHGARPSLSSYMWGTPIAWALAQAGLVYLLLLAGYGRRTGPLRSVIVESRLSPLEFVETLGALYHRAHAASSAVETCWNRFRFLVTRRLGLAPKATTRQISDAVRDRMGWKEPGLYDALTRAERAAYQPDLTDKEALQIVESLEQYVALLQLDRGAPAARPV